MSWPTPGQQPQPYGQFPPQAGQVPPQPSPQTAQLVLNLQKPLGLGNAALIRPNVQIDNFPAPGEWGRNAYAVPPGRRLVRVSSTYMWQYGAAEQTFDIVPGETVELHYATPHLTFLSGNLGYEPQRRRGLAAIVALGVFAILAVVGAILGAIFA